jgi:hypothetical protein
MAADRNDRLHPRLQLDVLGWFKRKTAFVVYRAATDYSFPKGCSVGYPSTLNPVAFSVCGTRVLFFIKK